MEHKLQELRGDKDRSDPIWEEYFHYVMERNGVHPTAVLEAGELFQKLLHFAKG